MRIVSPQGILRSGLKQFGALIARLFVANQRVSEGNNFTSHTTSGQPALPPEAGSQVANSVADRLPTFRRVRYQTRLEQVSGETESTWVRLLVGCRPCFASSALQSWWLKIYQTITV